jgi:hypothetical protein
LDENQMRAKEFVISEGAKSHGTFKGIGASADLALPGVWVQRQLRNTDPYMQYRYGLAMAASRADAAGHVEFEQESGWAENLTIVGYTAEDEEVIRMADKLMGVTGTRVADTASRETSDANTKSPVSNWNKRK